MYTSWMITHVERESQSLVKTLPNAEAGDLVFITGGTEGDVHSLGMLLERIDSQAHLWTTKLLSLEDLLDELASRLQCRLSGEGAQRMFMPMLPGHSIKHVTNKSDE